MNQPWFMDLIAECKKHDDMDMPPPSQEAQNILTDPARPIKPFQVYSKKRVYFLVWQENMGGYELESLSIIPDVDTPRIVGDIH